MSILVISPHHDDEVLGCGGIISRDPSKVSILQVTDCDDVRSSEYSNLIEDLGFTRSLCLEFEDGVLDIKSKMDLSSSIRRGIKTLERGDTPFDQVFIPFCSLHQDHKAVNHAALVALRDFKGEILEYEYPEGLAHFGEFMPNVYFELSSKELEDKIRLLDHYQSQLGLNRNEDAVRSLAKIRGHSSGFEYAEAFRLVRGIRKWPNYHSNS